MANFMGPMAPPQAAPSQPPQLDVKTSPSQRAQFKEFMQGMSRPAAPPTTAPIAPMLPVPMSSPMDQVDIFAPAPMADGGVVGGLNDLQKMSGQMVEALNTVVYGGGQGGGFGGDGMFTGGGMSSGGGFGGGNMPAPLPSIESLPMPNVYQDEMQMPSNSLPFAQPLPRAPYEFNSSLRKSYEQAQEEARRARANGFMGRVVMPGEMSFDDYSSSYQSTPVMFEDGGGVGSYFEDIPAASGPVMAGGTTNLIDSSVSGIRDTTIDNISDAFQLGQDLYDVNRSYDQPGRPMFGLSEYFAPGGFLNADYVPMQSVPTSVDRAMDFAGGIMSGMQVPGPMGGNFSVRPVVGNRGSSDSLGILANFSVPFRDGGGVTKTDWSKPADDPVNSPSSRAEADRYQAMADAYNRGQLGSFDGTPVFVDTSEDPAGGGDDRVAEEIRRSMIKDYSTPIDLLDVANVDVSGSSDLPQMDAATADRTTRRSGEIAMNLRDLADRQGILDEIMPVKAPVISYSDANLLDSEIFSRDMKLAGEMGQLDERIGVPAPDPLTSSYRGMDQEGDFDFGPAAPRTEDLVMNVLSTPVEYKTRGGKEISTTLEKDLINRQKPSGLPGILGKAADIFGTGRTGDILENIATGAPAVIDAGTGRAMGYVGSGPMGFGQTYTGRGGFDPFAPGANVRFDSSRNAYFVDYTPPGGDSDSDARLAQVVPPATDTADTTPPPVVTPPATPPSVPDPMDVIVPSTRRDVAISPPVLASQGSVGATFLPQSFLDLLASFNRPAPVAMQDGGAVLDKAADDFLGALRAVA